ncbi:unnamed protein product [Peniophora sp. CBMAI 1063]|nr:unnamed protein product [Peniophora sp. CBMAI 1063]
MAPVTRAATAPATPKKAFTKVASATPEWRKPPRCQICNRPRKGHPREGCPYGPPQTLDAPSPDTSLADAFGALRISAETGSAPVTPPPTTSNVLEDMCSIAKIRRERRRLMPGTLFPPSSDCQASETSSPPSTPTSGSWDPNESVEDISLAESLSLAQQPGAHSSRHLARSTSENAMEAFLDDLERVAHHVPVSVYTIPATDVEKLQSSAKKIGFHTAAVAGENRTPRDEASLIIGVDSVAVGDVRDKLVKEDVTGGKRSGKYGLAHIAGGVVVGAAALFTGLLM